MSKGIFLNFLIAAALSASPDLGAQIYRCEGNSGVVYSDLPCGASAEEIVLDVPEPASDSDQPQASVASAADSSMPQAERASPGISEGKQNISQFLMMLHDQRRQQMGEIDRTIASLRAQAQGDEFEQLEEARQAEILAELDRLESSRESILEEYSALIQEAQRRLE